MKTHKEPELSHATLVKLSAQIARVVFEGLSVTALCMQTTSRVQRQLLLRREQEKQIQRFEKRIPKFTLTNFEVTESYRNVFHVHTLLQNTQARIRIFFDFELGETGWIIYHTDLRVSHTMYQCIDNRRIYVRPRQNARMSNPTARGFRPRK